MDFLSIGRLQPSEEPPIQRVRHDREFQVTPAVEAAEREGKRCMDCGTPFCRAQCPLGNDIPRCNRLVAKGDFEGAYLALRQTNPFPEFTGRICPAPCESACTLGLIREPVAIETLEKTIADEAEQRGLNYPRLPLSRSAYLVAIIGAGPAGLAAAYWLNQWGHRVTVYDRAMKAGGLLMNGIPNFKLDKRRVERRIEILKREGIRFCLGVEIGKTIGMQQVRSDYDAVLLACGATEPRLPKWDLGEASGIVLADHFLCKAIHGKAARQALRDRRVVVLGGGDTGADCVGTALRQSAKSVVQLDIKEQPDDFPEFPRLATEASVAAWPAQASNLRFSSSHFEGGERRWQCHAISIATQKGAFAGVNVRVGSEGAEEMIAADLLIVAIGYLGAERQGPVSELSIKLDDKQRVDCDGFRTTAAGVYAAGDMRLGASLVVTALAEGRKAAEVIHRDLVQQVPSPRFPGANDGSSRSY